jgi:hypothetical protein
MEMRVVVADGGSASTLAQRLAVEFGGERVRLGRDQPEVGVEVRQDSDRALLRLLDAVEGWLDGAVVASAVLWFGEHSYRLARRAPIASGL